MQRQSLGDRMKEQYETRYRILLPRRTYTILRLDGRAFHTLTKNYERPYDKRFMQMMDLMALDVASDRTFLDRVVPKLEGAADGPDKDTDSIE